MQNTLLGEAEHVMLLDGALGQLALTIASVEALQGKETRGLAMITSVKTWMATVRPRALAAAKPGPTNRPKELPMPVIGGSDFEGSRVLAVAVRALEGFRVQYEQFRLLHYSP